MSLMFRELTNMAEVLDRFIDIITFRWLTSAIFDKELRVASRRRRYYLLRVIYISVLLLIVWVGWFKDLGWWRWGGGGYTSAYMAERAKLICAYICQYQFFGLQIAAVILLSGAITEEINKRTLGVLLVTPITGRQIITGKILSKMLQILLLLCLSLPVLAIIRVFGGVPWGLIVLSACITVSALFLVSSVTIFISTFCRNAHTALFISSITIFLYFLSGNLWPVLRFLSIFLQADGQFVISFVNPFIAFKALLTYSLFQNTYYQSRLYSIAGPSSSFKTAIIVLIQCSVFLLISLLLILLSAWRVRKAALAEPKLKSKRNLRHILESLVNKLPRFAREKPLRDVKGHSVVWKEMHNSFFRSELLRGRFIYLFLMVSIIIVHLIILFMIFWNDPFDVLWFSIISMVVIGIFITCVTAAGAISKEKETASWQILLCTPLSDWQILWGKISGILRRSCVMWLLLLIFCAILAYANLFHFNCLMFISITACGTTALLAGAGIYFGTRCKNNTNAVMSVVTLAAILWLLPTSIFGLFLDYYNDAAIILMPINPLVQVLQACELYGAECDYDFIEWYDFSELLILVIVVSSAYTVAGLIFTWRAKCLLRRKIF
jgi:ABC-type transport system involved in multi-copper enzyme maturation permease subunit